MLRQIITLVTIAILAQVSWAGDSSFPTIEVVGNKFFYSNNGSQFYIRGVAYQENTEDSDSFKDPLADGDACKRDIKYLQEIKTNVLRVYSLNTSVKHDTCMKALADAGIYVIADLSEPSESINRDDPEWNLDLYKRYANVIDEFQTYNNTLGFFAGNEVTNNKSNTDASPFVKAAIRDMKKYIKSKKYRTIPVGYSTSDDATIRAKLPEYFSCGSEEERADFFGLNNYEWCGDSSFSSSGYEERTEEYKNLTIPVFFSEYGCNEKKPRKFTDVPTIYGDKMTDVWSGGIVYMYFQEENDYGLVSVKGSSVSTLSDFKYLSLEMASISPSSAKSSSQKASTLSCPATGSSWQAATKLPPTPDEDTCDCIAKSLECVVADSVDEDDYGDLFGSVCGEISCDAINVNGKKGTYGKFSYCSTKDKLSYVLNAYYEKNGKKLSACSFKGSASINKSASSAKSCSKKTSEATGNDSSSSGSSDSGSEGSGSSSGSSSGSTSSSTKLSFANLNARKVTSGELITVVIMITSFVCGFSFVMF
ncbi:uncharacterized protein PRCAT00004839001 [Priceomyces carsonii]|uniref:uncharacterized protein n=1 Tax=Priceomyces carsonii TaxID=28549 RepID=UPI002EDB0E60|nr:unnamed protein product [Priceomyces carsonii]